MNLSANFTLEELTRSETAARLGIQNVPSKSAIKNMKALCENVLQPARDTLGPIIITSGYRCGDLNRALHGSENSQHQFGQAADFYPMHVPIGRLFRWIYDSVPYDQLIWEHGGRWIHCSYSRDTNRYEVHGTRRDQDGVIRYPVLRERDIDDIWRPS